MNYGEPIIAVLDHTFSVIKTEISVCLIIY